VGNFAQPAPRLSATGASCGPNPLTESASTQEKSADYRFTHTPVFDNSKSRFGHMLPFSSHVLPYAKRF
jgi:hypothetical protein